MTSKEYTIFITCKRGKPYCLSTYNSFYEAEIKLNEIIELEKKRHRPYYVENEYFKNEYIPNLNCTIYCIKERNVSKREKFSQENFQKEIKNSKSNIIKFFSYDII